MEGIARLLIFGGLLLLGVGLVLLFAGRFLPLGRLPGDLVYRRGNLTVYFPLATLILLNLAIAVVMWLINRRR